MRGGKPTKSSVFELYHNLPCITRHFLHNFSQKGSQNAPCSHLYNSSFRMPNTPLGANGTGPNYTRQFLCGLYGVPCFATVSAVCKAVVLGRAYSKHNPADLSVQLFQHLHCADSLRYKSGKNRRAFNAIIKDISSRRLPNFGLAAIFYVDIQNSYCAKRLFGGTTISI